jgi:hypothetical protein
VWNKKQEKHKSRSNKFKETNDYYQNKNFGTKVYHRWKRTKIMGYLMLKKLRDIKEKIEMTKC